MSVFRSKLIAAAVTAALAGAPQAYAGPTPSGPLPFTEPWQVAPSSAVIGDATFGFLNVNNAIGNAVASARNPFFPLGGAAASSASISFFRPFTLAPGAMYTLSLDASLSGNLRTLFATDTANVNADALIEEQGGPIVLNLTPGLGISYTISAPITTLPIDTGVTKASTAVGAIPPGDYDIFAHLDVTASTTRNLFAGVEAVANIYNSGFLVSGVVTAVTPPAPVPTLSPVSSLALLAVAFAGLGLIRRWPVG